jgi:hypothetical protein
MMDIRFMLLKMQVVLYLQKQIIRKLDIHMKLIILYLVELKILIILTI